MESNWRRGVWEAGWGYDRFLLCARLLSGVFFHDRLAVRTAGAIREVVAGQSSLTGYVPVWDHLFFTNQTGFPYGFDVAPD